MGEHVDVVDTEAHPSAPSGPGVCEQVGCTYRQLDYWCRSGYIPGQGEWSGSGRPRRFTADQVRAVRALARLSDLTIGTRPNAAELARIAHDETSGCAVLSGGRWRWWPGSPGLFDDLPGCYIVVRIGDPR